MSGRLAGRTALVTGASRGIGAAVAERFADEGARVVLAHQPTADMAALAQARAGELQARGHEAVAMPGDLATADGPAELVAAARAAIGPLDIVVANAAATGRGAAVDLSVEQFDAVQAVNTRGTWLLARAAHPDLVASSNSSLITVTSVMVATGQPGAVHYTASKAAILGMTRALAREWGPQGIRVNTVMPGAIRTEYEAETDPDADAVAAQILPLQCLQRRGTAADLTGTFLFLASDDSSFLTGQTLCVDGGWIHY
ncbi:SDR family NAD(P)-dependent oxidoreductase [Kribbella sp.]|uniref:SDR family NAD(P)-dependent oxidoreductase n=1 Tax=Kribbella sp. TaxID=1871183 RepID=UPI002D3A0D1F|nr:SDR family NAD(P)-dependent oxidoreductase [Kribbella sp.]HZX07821.1 SDR family NAD(P)-dependent oxidoreductase [Kribbella sp.]